MTGTDPAFDAALADLPERHRDEVLAAYAALEHGTAPVHEAQLLGLRDATLRAALQRLLHELGRTLVQAGPHLWTSGYRDDVAATLTADGWHPLPMIDRAVLVLILIHSVAVPRSQGTLERDAWASTHPTSTDELNRYSQLPREQVRAALARLRAAGLVQLVPERGRGPGQGAAYLPGPQLQRLTPVARRRLQEELVLAAAPDTPLAAAIRSRRHPPPLRGDKASLRGDQGIPIDQGNAVDQAERTGDQPSDSLITPDSLMTAGVRRATEMSGSAAAEGAGSE